MAEKGFKRKLTAILSADVEGYSRLMGDDEQATVRTLTSYREVLSTLIQQHNGKVLDSPGDNLLAEFVSVVDAVQCAVAVQKEISARNDQLPENRRMQFRIGINLGDVIQEKERIYGDGVNIAARLEGLANPGGICISKTAFDQIESKLPYGYEFLGDQTVKNIAKPVSAYRVLMEPRVTVAGEPEKEKRSPVRRMPILVGAVVVLVSVIAAGIWQFYARLPSVEPASVEKMAYPLPDKPSIAVLPFTNLSGDPNQEYLSDGLTEEIITALSKTPKLFVIARNSVFAYKGKSVKVAQISEELGVRYVLEGSVRKAGDRVRITAQLIDATTGHHLWAERYDRGLKDIFDLQDEITLKMIIALQVKLTDGQQARLLAKGTNNLDAYLKLLQGREQFYRMNKEDNALGRQLIEEAIALDPDYANAYAYLASTHMIDAWLGSSKSPRGSLTQAIELAQKAIALDESDANAHGLLGYLYMMIRQHEKAIAVGERAVALDPNSANAHAWLGNNLYWAGRPEDAIPLILKAIRFNPIPPTWCLFTLGMAYRETGRYEEAISACKRALHREPNNLIAQIVLVATYSVCGREQEARAEAAEVLRIDPKFSLVHLAKIRPHKNKANTDRFIDSLRKAGLK